MQNVIVKWFLSSNHYKHIIGGFLIGMGAEDWYCALYAGTGVAAALELKDKLYGNMIDFVDFAITVAGAVTGYLFRLSAVTLLR